MPPVEILNNEKFRVIMMTLDDDCKKYLFDISKGGGWCCDRYPASDDRDIYGTPFFFLKRGSLCYIAKKIDEKKEIPFGLSWPAGGQFYTTSTNGTYFRSQDIKDMREAGVFQAMKDNGHFSDNKTTIKNLSLFANNPTMMMGGPGITYEGIYASTVHECLSPLAISSIDLEDAKKHPALAFVWYWQIEKREDLIPIIASHPISAYHFARKLGGNFKAGELAIATDSTGFEYYKHFLSSKNLFTKELQKEMSDLAQEFEKIRKKFLEKKTKTNLAKLPKLEEKPKSNRAQKKEKRKMIPNLEGAFVNE